MSLAERIATIFPYPNVAIQIKKHVPDIKLSDGVSLEEDQGYDIHFVFTSIKIEAIRHVDSLNLSNRAIQDIVEDVCQSFDKMADEVMEDKAVH